MAPKTPKTRTEPIPKWCAHRVAGIPDEGGGGLLAGPVGGELPQGEERAPVLLELVWGSGGEAVKAAFLRNRVLMFDNILNLSYRYLSYSGFLYSDSGSGYEHGLSYH